MTEPVGVDLRIEQRADEVTFSTGSNRWTLHLRDAAWLRLGVAKCVLAVEEVRPVGLPVGRTEARDFLADVKRLTRQCLRACVPPQHTNAELRASSARIAEVLARSALRGTAARVEIIVQDAGAFFPWEWLGSEDRADDVETEAATTLAFAAAVSRHVVVPTAGTYSDSVLDASDRLQVRLIRNAELPSARIEKRYFTHEHRVRVVGPSPDTALGPFAFAEQLTNPRYTWPGRPLPTPDQVVHLLCHHESGVNIRTATPYELAMASGVLDFGTGYEITLAALSDGLYDADQPAGDAAHQPLVFLNACRGNFQPFTAQQAVDSFLENGNRAVVSTSVKVPGDSAALVARKFYERLFAGCRGTEALRLARWDALSERGTPTGLLYSYYGNPDLHVAPLAGRAHCDDSKE